MTAVVDAISRVLGICERIFLVLANTCLIAMLGINIVNIVQRGLIDKGILWVFPWTTVLFVWMTFLGFFVIYRRKKDITVDFVIDRLGAKGRMASQVLVNVIVMFLMVVMLWQAPRIIAQQVGPIQVVGLERYTLSIPLFISCTLILLNFVLDTIRLFHDGGDDSQPEPASEG